MVRSDIYVKFLIPVLFLVLTSSAQEPDDPYIWLEDIDGEKAMNWVLTQNEKTVQEIQSHPEFDNIRQNVLEVLNSDERIAYPSMHGKYVYNFWQDEKFERGIWRRAPLEKYLKDSVQWEILLDMDELSTAEDEKWAFKGASYLYPDTSLCMIHLSRGGGDAVEIREFDLRSGKFVKDGFFLPQAKSSISWIDENTLMVSTDFGEGTLTTSGYPRVVKIWERGTSLEDAKVIYEGREDDMGVWAYVINTPERQYLGVYRSITFYSSEFFVLENGELIKIDIPEDAEVSGFFKNQLLVVLKSNWDIAGNSYQQGALISIDFDKFLEGSRNFQVIYLPDERSSLASVSNTKTYLLLNKITNVRSELIRYEFKDGRWNMGKVEAPDFGSIGVKTTDDFSDRYFFTFTNFLEPSSLYFVNEDQSIKKIKSLPNFFNSDDFEVGQHEVKSTDGTVIPYFIVFPRNMKYDGSNPTLLYGYGGFEVSMKPRYSATIGNCWLEKGGVYVVANIRGGGEFGPKWHQAALKEKRQVAFDDFHAVAEDLIQKKITSRNISA